MLRVADTGLRRQLNLGNLQRITVPVAASGAFADAIDGGGQPATNLLVAHL